MPWFFWIAAYFFDIFIAWLLFSQSYVQDYENTYEVKVLKIKAYILKPPRMSRHSYQENQRVI